MNFFFLVKQISSALQQLPKQILKHQLVALKGICLAFEHQSWCKNVIVVALSSRHLNHRLEIWWLRQCTSI